MKFRNKKAQSAMEYLMTYGWAILVIAIVMAALFSITSITGGGGLSGCTQNTGFLCSNPVLHAGAGASTATVNLSITFGQSLGYTIYNVGIGCSAVASSGLPYIKTATQNGIVYLSASGTAGSAALVSGADYNAGAAPTTGSLSLSTSSTVVANSIACFDGSGNIITTTTEPKGTAFSGIIWINYTTGSGATTAASGTNPVLTAKVATLNTKVV